MNYLEMSQNEIIEIVKRGGDKLIKLNREVAKHLDSLKLSQYAVDIISDTDINNIAEVFGGLFTAEEVEDFIINDFIVEDILDLVLDIRSEAQEEKKPVIDKTINGYINDATRSKYPDYNEEQKKYIISEVEKRYLELTR